MRIAPLDKQKFARTYERCRMEQMSGRELAQKGSVSGMRIAPLDKQKFISTEGEKP